MAEPLRAAAIDIGSNGMRFLVVDAVGPDTFHVVHKERAAVRLGHHTFTQGHLDPEVVKQALKALKAFRQKADDLGCHRIRAVATSAVREAEDRLDFVRAARKKAGLRVEVIDGREETRLVHRAVRTRIPWGDKPWIIMDLGGGSLEIALVGPDAIHWSESRRIGTVRLLETHAEGGEGPPLAEHIHGEVDRFQLLHSSEGLDIGGVAATGGNINDIARMDGAHPRSGDPVTIAMDDLDELRRGLEQQTVAERIAAHGFRPDRADVVAPAAMVYERVAFLAGADAIHVPGWGVREGVVLDLMDAHFGHRAELDPLDKRVEDSSLAVGRTFRFDEDHGQHVAALALSIFDQTQDVHGLPRGDRRVLQAAAILHDVGYAIAALGHHKHSQYIIGHADLGGISEKDIQVASCVARYHRRAFPAARHPGYRDVGTAGRKRVDRLAAILRIAEGLDRSHLQNVVAVDVDVRPTIVGMSLHGRGSLETERWAADRKADLFRQVFQRHVEIDAP